MRLVMLDSVLTSAPNISFGTIISRDYINSSIKEIIACQKLIFDAAYLWQDNFGNEDAKIYAELNEEYRFDLQTKATSLLIGAPDKITRLALADRFYWEFETIKEETIALGVTGSVNSSLEFICATKITKRCWHCRCDNKHVHKTVNTREELRQFNKSVPKCDGCLEKQRKFEKRQQLKHETFFDEKDPEILELMPYDKYLKTRHWKELRIAKFNEIGRRCQFCPSTHNLIVHHRTYARRGREKLSDLAVLCKDCHDALHKARGNDPFTNGN